MESSMKILIGNHPETNYEMQKVQLSYTDHRKEECFSFISTAAAGDSLQSSILNFLMLLPMYIC